MTELFDGEIHGGLSLLAAGRVGLEGKYAAGGARRDIIGHGLRLVVVAARDHDFGAGAGQRMGHGLA